MRTTEEFIEKYCGAFPDVHRRTPFKSWHEIRKAMEEDIKAYAREACREQREKCAGQYNYYQDDHHTSFVESKIKNAPEPDLK